MQNYNPPLTFCITKKIRDIPQEDWNNLFGEEIIEGYGYQKTLEEAKLTKFSFGYLVGRREKKIVAIIPFFYMDFSFDTLIQGPLHGLISRLKRLFSLKVLFLGSPTTEEFYLGVAKSEDISTLMDWALEELLVFCKKEHIKGLAFYNLSEKNKLLAGYLKKNKFIELEGLPTTLVEINSGSFEEYMKGLSHNTRKDLKRKLRKSLSLTQLNTELREDIEDISSQIYKLYLNNLEESDVHFEVLTEGFFKNICRNMRGIAKYFITYDKGTIVAFNLCLIKDNLFIDKFIGFDSEVAHKYHLYFTSFCHNIEWCIKNNIRYYQPGATDYHPKLRLGAKLIPLYVYVKAFNPILNFLIKLFSKWIEPKNTDTSWKDIKK